jgi:hypothetical protein
MSCAHRGNRSSSNTSPGASRTALTAVFLGTGQAISAIVYFFSSAYYGFTLMGLAYAGHSFPTGKLLWS